MPQRKCAIKELRINKRRRIHNLQLKTDLKKAIKKFKALAEKKDSQEALSALSIVFKKIDKAVKRNILHKNTAARKKSFLHSLLKSKA